MNPLKISSKEFAYLKNKPVIITFADLKLTGKIREVYLASNSPHLPGSFDFELSPESKLELKNSGMELQKNFATIPFSTKLI
jgi:hypothetical protein